jgi:NAD(P)-dependent dehydrogenase (short-subunit alcohol dehydrogenase family)
MAVIVADAQRIETIMGQLDGKVAVITGSSRGLGYAIAEAYAREGAAVVLSARSANQLRANVDVLTSKGWRAAGFPCDVGDLDSVRSLAANAVNTFGKIDIWVNNAGVSGIYGPTADNPVERVERVIRTNILGTYYGSITALEYFLPQRSGKLINLLGRGDDKPVPMQNAYASSKAWIRSFTLALAQEYKDSGIGVFAFNPGLVDTDMLRKLESAPGYEAKLKPLSTVIQLWANDPDVPAEKALWLASPATDGKTGLAVSVLTRTLVIGGALRFLLRKITRRPQRDATLDITTVGRQD